MYNVLADPRYPTAYSHQILLWMSTRGLPVRFAFSALIRQPARPGTSCVLAIGMDLHSTVFVFLKRGFCVLLCFI